MRLSRGRTTQTTSSCDIVRAVVSLLFILRMCVFLGLRLAALASFAADAAGSPALPNRAATMAGFVPPGWVIEQQLSSDFNRDGRADALVLLRMAPAATQPPRLDTGGPTATAGLPDDGSTVRRSSPRVVAVLLGSRNGYVVGPAKSRKPA